MSDDTDPIDLGPLDPARRPERWAARMESTRMAVAAALLARARIGPLEILSGWARPILAAAAVLLAVLGAAAGALAPVAAAQSSEARRLAVLSETALARGQLPTGAELRAALGPRGEP